MALKTHAWFFGGNSVYEDDLDMMRMIMSMIMSMLILILSKTVLEKWDKGGREESSSVEC